MSKFIVLKSSVCGGSKPDTWENNFSALERYKNGKVTVIQIVLIICDKRYTTTLNLVVANRSDVKRE